MLRNAERAIRGMLRLAASASWLRDQSRCNDRRTEDEVERGNVLRSLRLDPALEERILALDPDHISDHDVRSTLAAGAHAENHTAACERLSGLSDHDLVCDVSRGHGLPRGKASRSGRRRVLAESVREQRAACRRDRVVLRTRRRQADDRRPQPGRHAGDQGALHAGRRVRAQARRMECRDRRSRRPIQHRRSAGWDQASGRGTLGDLCHGGRRGRRGVHAAQPMGHAAPAANHPRYRR